jgi:preprotein translocase subunit SecE
MADPSNPESPGGGQGSGGATATADGGRGKPDKKGKQRMTNAGGTQPRPGGADQGNQSSFFEVYKPGQGYYTRMGTAVGCGALILFGGHFLYTQLESSFASDASWTLWVAFCVPAAVVAGIGLLLYWLVGVKRGSCDFLIATEGEMKKVSWSTRSELIGSTKVVIWFTILLSAMLFLVDYMFIGFFRFINVITSAGS